MSRSKALPEALETAYWPLRVPRGSWWLYDAHATYPRETFRRFETPALRSEWLVAHGYTPVGTAEGSDFSASEAKWARSHE